ncbi:lipopolysaccharide biosynthesis protein [Conexibacter sp. JD483]|uniref:lipopolysaccharide biosynthesis protein n=1 Tax=unclassified Conexibacter TaxID=2627773 RepID=UPI002724E7D2|nr:MULTISPECIES: lipopolysaccharide biosynthesis protein [unclassified Conexibacter]MDO8184241.1 lipopolysaccharide biosynthesis protein [Conexibacter sp. CPCC 205706]MDO8197233.1 lipopolysaccharide biosynthesis protein [Conexibacter sp. CPCC 205762]MDR9367452.1 lipopolysaccharide biosynthesis protein [Conexibacter sp. JD483]
MSERGHSLATRTLRGMAWAYGAYVGGRMLVLVQTAILARLLTPSDFGVVALALTFMVFLDAVKDLGLGQALIIGEEHEAEARAQTAFGWGVIIGLTLTLLTAAAGPLAASFFHEPELKAMLPVLGATFLVRSLGATHYALARKQLDYRVRTFSEITEVVVRGVVGIGLALGGAGAWSLAIGFLCGTVASTLTLWALVDFRPRAQLTRAHLKSMLAFGGMLTLVDMGAVLAYNLDYLFIGRVLGSASLGYYSIAFRMPELIVLNLASVAGDVLFPAYAAVDKRRLREAYLVALRYTAMLTLPIAAALIILARPVIHVLFGDQWDSSVDVMQVLTVYALCATLAIPCGTVFKVTNRAWIMVAFTVPALVVLVILLAFVTDEGIMAVAKATTAIQLVALPATALIAARVLKLPLLRSLTPIVPSLFGALVMAAAMYPIEHFVSSPLLALVAGGLAGVAVYLGMLLLVARDDLRRLRAIAAPRLATS